MLPDVLVAAAIFLALVLASLTLAQVVADFVVWHADAQSAAFQSMYPVAQPFEDAVPFLSELPPRRPGS